MKRVRRLLPRIAIIFLAVFLLLLPSCSPEQPESPPASTPPASTLPTSQSEPQKTPPLTPHPEPQSTNPSQTRIESYTIADTTGDWGYPSPYLRYSRGPGYIRMQFIFETLIWKNTSDFVPQLAKEWEYIEAENAYIFKLRDDVSWHDGEKFTAGDVVFTVNYIKNHPDPFVTLIGPSGIKEATALDDYTVKFYLEQTYAPFLNDIAGTMVIFPQHIWEGVDDPKSLTGPEAVIGTGPYTLADYSKEHGTYLYKANHNYYLGQPAVEEIKFVKISEEMIPAALKEGSVDAGDIPPEVVTDMQAAGLTIISAPVAWNAKLTINHQKEPLSDKRFRQALAYGIDREALVEITQRGHAIAGSPGLVPPTSEWYNPDTPQYEYSMEKARQLLEEMGYSLEGEYFIRDGRPLELELLASPTFKDVGQFIAQQLEELGIKVNFQTLEAKTVDSKVEAWDFDLSIYGHGGLYEPSILKRVIMDQGFNSARYTSNEELNRLLEGQLKEMNPEARKGLVFQIQSVYAEDLPALTLYYPKWYWAHDGRINLYYTMDGISSGVPIPVNRMSFVE